MTPRSRTSTSTPNSTDPSFTGGATAAPAVEEIFDPGDLDVVPPTSPTVPSPTVDQPMGQAESPDPATHVLYVGDVQERTITEQDWRNVGVENQTTVTWNEAGRFAVATDRLTPAAMERLRHEGPTFVVPEASPSASAEGANEGTDKE